MSEVSRRDFLKKAGALAAGATAAGSASAAGMEGKRVPPGLDAPGVSPAPGQMGEAPSMGGMHDMAGGHGQRPLTEAGFPRYEEGREYSPPPPLMGKQMGTVQTLNTPPLGYEMDGDVKVFRLIAQPVW